MINRKPYDRSFTVFQPWMFKAIGLVIAGAALTIIALAISKGISVRPDPAQGGRFVGHRHEAATISPTIGTSAGVSSLGSEPAANTVVRNGITVVSPQLLVPTIDIAALQSATGANDSVSKPRKRSRLAKRSQSQRQKQIAASRWKAYGLAIR